MPRLTLAARIAAILGDDEPRLGRALYDTGDPARIAALVEGFCVRELGAGVAYGEIVVGHSDWRVEHLHLLRAGRISAVFDCDSFAVGPEPVFAGLAAHGFCADWTVEGLDCVPTLEESMAFLDDYARARGKPFGARERRTAHVALVPMMAYSARCEYSDLLTDFGSHPPRPPQPDVPPGGYLAFLAEHGPALLGVPADGVPRVRGR